VPLAAEEVEEYISAADIPKLIEALERDMRGAAKKLDFERAAELRDRVKALRDKELAMGVRVD